MYAYDYYYYYYYYYYYIITMQRLTRRVSVIRITNRKRCKLLIALTKNTKKQWIRLDYWM